MLKLKKNTVTLLCVVALLSWSSSASAAWETLGEWDFNEATGSATLTDISGNGNDGVVSAGVTFDGGVAMFDGTTDAKILVSNALGNLDLDHGRVFRITVDLVDVPVGGWAAIMGNRLDDMKGVMLYRWAWPAASLALWAGDGGVVDGWNKATSPENTYAAGDDLQVILEYDGVDTQSLTYSVDGGAAVTVTTVYDLEAGVDYNPAPSLNDWYFGVRGAELGGNYFDGGIDNIKIEAGLQIAISSSNDLGQILEGDSVDITIELAQAPTSDVTVTINNPASISPGFASDPNDLRLNGLDGLTLTFTSGDWNVPQTVTVEAFDDTVEEDTLEDLVLSFSVASADPEFDNGFTKGIAVTVVDNDSAGVLVYVTDGSTDVYEGAVAGPGSDEDTFDLTLASPPIADVTIYPVPVPLQPLDPNDITASPESLTFTVANWDVPQTVTVTAIDDDALEAITQAVSVELIVSSAGDPAYNSLTVANVPVVVYENDCGPSAGGGANIADLNGDCEVNMADFAILAAQWLECTRPNDPLCE